MRYRQPYLPTSAVIGSIRAGARQQNNDLQASNRKAPSKTEQDTDGLKALRYPTGERFQSMPTQLTRQMVLTAAAICEEKKGEDTRILELDPADSGFTDFFVITSATNDRQCVAIADEIELRLKREFGMYANSVEGRRQGEWVLLDYVDFVVHIFLAERRAFYDIERLRKSARQVDLDELKRALTEKTIAARSKKAPAKKAATKKTVAKPAAPAKKIAAKKMPAADKSSAHKSPAKKAVAKKAPVKKSVAQKPVAKPAAAKKAALKKTAAPKAVASKSAKATTVKATKAKPVAASRGSVAKKVAPTKKATKKSSR